MAIHLSSSSLKKKYLVIPPSMRWGCDLAKRASFKRSRLESLIILKKYTIAENKVFIRKNMSTCP